jgi:hypothetical protein
MAVEVSGVTPRAHHSWIKGQPPLQSPTSDRLSVTQLTPLRLRFQRTSQQHAMPVRSPALPQPHPRSWLVNARWKPEDSFTRTQVFLFSVIHTLSCWLALCNLFALGLAVTAPQDWNVSQRLLLAFCYLLIIGSLTAVWCCLQPRPQSQAWGLWSVIAFWLCYILKLSHWVAGMTARLA